MIFTFEGVEHRLDPLFLPKMCLNKAILGL